MATYTVRDPQTGKTVKLTGDSPPTEQELTDIFAKMRPVKEPEKAQGSFALGDVATVKPAQPFAGVGIQTVSDDDWAKMSANERLQGLLNAAGKSFGFGASPEGRDVIDNPKTTLATAAIPSIVKAVPAVASAVADIPVVRAGLSRLPTKANAGAKFKEVMAAAHDVPIDVTKPLNVAMRIYDLSKRGGTLPKAVRDFLTHAIDPDKPDMTYRIARDFASNISRLSSNEYQRLTPAIAREVHALRVSLNGAVEQAAAKVDKAALYRQAMNQYARAARVGDFVEKATKEGLKWGAGAIGAGAAYKLLKD